MRQLFIMLRFMNKINISLLKRLTVLLNIQYLIIFKNLMIIIM